MFIFDRILHGLHFGFLFSFAFTACCSAIFFIDWLNHTRNNENCEFNAYNRATREKIYKVVARNLIFTVPSYAVAQSLLIDWIRCVWQPVLPLWIAVILFIVLSDICFFILHRIAHTSLFYQTVHKQHHEINVAFAPGAVYSTVWEMWFVNLLSATIPFCLLGFTDDLIYWFVIIGAIDTSVAHSRFSNFHYQHHRFINTAYGSSLSLVDHVLKTFISDNTRRMKMWRFWLDDPHLVHDN